jgi:hypothetical protein
MYSATRYRSNLWISDANDHSIGSTGPLPIGLAPSAIANRDHGGGHQLCLRICKTAGCGAGASSIAAIDEVGLF